MVYALLTEFMNYSNNRFIGKYWCRM